MSERPAIGNVSGRAHRYRVYQVSPERTARYGSTPSSWKTTTSSNGTSRAARSSAMRRAGSGRTSG